MWAHVWWEKFFSSFLILKFSFCVKGSEGKEEKEIFNDLIYAVDKFSSVWSENFSHSPCGSSLCSQIYDYLSKNDSHFTDDSFVLILIIVGEMHKSQRHARRKSMDEFQNVSMHTHWRLSDTETKKNGGGFSMWNWIKSINWQEWNIIKSIHHPQHFFLPLFLCCRLNRISLRLRC